MVDTFGLVSEHNAIIVHYNLFIGGTGEIYKDFHNC